MKNNIIIIFAFIFLFIVKTHIATAQEATPLQSPTPTSIEYQMPYPGILPGHPFYFLKIFRDNMMSLLISSPLKKAEFDLLQSDKDLQATVYLTEKKQKSNDVFQTLQKSDDYFSSAIDKTKEAKKQGIYIGDFVAQITIANLKHQEIVLGFENSAKGGDKKKFDVSLKNLKKFAENIKTLKLK